jgi:hypothetical protein
VDYKFGRLWGGWYSNELAGSYGVGLRTKEEPLVSHLLFADDNMIFYFFFRQIVNNSVICDVYFYVLKQFRG